MNTETQRVIYYLKSHGATENEPTSAVRRGCVFGFFQFDDQLEIAIFMTGEVVEWAICDHTSEPSIHPTTSLYTVGLVEFEATYAGLMALATKNKLADYREFLTSDQ